MYNFSPMKKPDYLRRIMEINRISLSEVDSTNNYAAKLLLEGKVPHGTVISALHQYQGRGQRSNTWESAPGQNLTASWVLHLDNSHFEKIVALNKAISLAIRNSIAHYLPKSIVKIKWPNDIFVNEKKVSGTLIETQMHADKTATLICGIGVNVHQTKFQSVKATSLFQENPNLDIALDDLMENIHQNIALYFNEWNSCNSTKIEQEYLSQLLGMNERRSFEHQGNVIEGVIIGVDEWGRLKLETKDGMLMFQAGDIVWQ